MVGRPAVIFGRQSSIGGVAAGSVSAVKTGSTISTPPGACGFGLVTPTTSTVVSSLRDVDLGEGGLVLDHDLRGAGAVAHHHEGQAAQPTAPVDPAAEADRRARLVGVRRKVGGKVRGGRGADWRTTARWMGYSSSHLQEVNGALEVWATGKLAVPPHLRRH